jgi:3',5'-cyclic AMP phosphodiesterase CpdA
MSNFTRRDILKAGAACALSPLVAARAAWSADAVDPYADAVLVKGEPPKPEKGSFTIAVLPDTQHYSEKFPDHYLAQTRWIAENIRDRNIAAVFHLGDITNRSTPAEWEIAAKAMSQLDGKVPYFLTAGNHDYSEGGVCKDRTTRLNDYFPVKKFRELNSFGGTYDREPERLENSYHLFSAADRDFLVICLEFGPRADVVRWANDVAAKNKNRAAILLTHAYMYYDDTRYDWAKYGKKQNWNPHSYGVAEASGGGVCDGEELWQRLVSKHDNFVLTMNGHVLQDGLGRTISRSPTGRDVHQVLVNFQMKPNGGDGWLRLLEYRADGTTVQTYDYSPTRNERNESPQNQFAMRLSAPV